MVKIKFKIGDYIRSETSVGKIVGILNNNRPPVEWKVDIISLCAGGGVVRTFIFRAPIYISMNYEPATEDDFLKAAKLVRMSEASFRALMNRVKQPHNT